MRHLILSLLVAVPLASQTPSPQQPAPRNCNDQSWNVSPYGGPHLALLNALPPAGADSATIAQAWGRVSTTSPTALATQMRALEAGMASGWTASRHNVARVVEQIDLLKEQLVGAPDTVVRAIAGYRDFLTTRYRAREEGDLGSLSGGAECYRVLLRQMTGIDTPPESLARIAATRRAAVDAELAPILRRLVGDRPLAEAKRALRTEPRFLFTTRQEMLDSATAIEHRLTPAVAHLFRNPPSTPLIIAPTPAVRERSDAPARYGAPAGPGQPGTFFLNTWRPDSQPRWGIVTAVSHEGAPGHHFERTYQRTVTVPQGGRGGTGAYTEGWGMYAEEVAVRESDVLNDDLSRAGLLMHYLDAWNALELDIRIHLQGMKREEVIAAIIASTGKSRTIAEVYADRHVATPGQLASYMIGYLTIRDLRDEAERTLGPRFDVRDFHERFLETGPISLALVQERMRAWIGKERGGE